MNWILIICAGISWAGCGNQMVTTYPSEESCYRALKAMRVVDQPIGESEKKRSMYAYCAPKEAK